MLSSQPIPRFWLACCLLAFCQAGARAQTSSDESNPANSLPLTNQFGLLVPQPAPAGPATPGTGEPGTPSMGASVLAGSTPAARSYFPGEHGLVQCGAFNFYPGLLYHFTYGSGIQGQPGKNGDTAVNAVQPDILTVWRDVWSLDYSPTLTCYTSRFLRNTVDQSLLLQGKTTTGNWSLGLAQAYSDTSQPLVETGAQTTQQAYLTAINAVDQINSRLALQLSVDQYFHSAEAFTTVHEWTTADWLNYQIAPRLGAGVGVTLGYDQLSPGSDMPFEDAEGRISFQLASKLALTLAGGFEDRQFVKPYARALVTPIFSATALFQISPRTAFSLFGSRAVTPAFFSNQVNVITTVGASLRQNLVKTAFLEVDAGYTDEPFQTIVGGGTQPGIFNPPQTVVRSDSTKFAKVTLGAVLRKRFTGSIFCMASQNSSSQYGFSYSSTQVGFELNYRY